MATGRELSRKIGVLRLALTGAIASAVFFLFCWVGAKVPVGTLTHMYIQLFTKADPNSTAALAEGFGWSAGFGLIGGAFIAWVYNLLVPLEPK